MGFCDRGFSVYWFIKQVARYHLYRKTERKGVFLFRYKRDIYLQYIHIRLCSVVKPARVRQIV